MCIQHTAIKLLLTESAPLSLLLKCSITSHLGLFVVCIVFPVTVVVLVVVDNIVVVILFVVAIFSCITIDCVEPGDLKSITFDGVGCFKEEHRRACFLKFEHVS